MKINKVIFSLFIIFSLSQVFAQDFQYPKPPENLDFKNFRGRRLPEGEFQFREFSVIGLRFYEEGDNVCLDLFFNREIDPFSVLNENILINEKTYSDAKLLFTKNSRGVRLVIAKKDFKMNKQGYDIIVKGIKSFDGKEHKDISISDIPLNSDYRYFERDDIWKKS